MTQETFLALRPPVKMPGWVERCDYRVVDHTNYREAFDQVYNAPVVAWDSEFEPRHTGHLVEAFSFSAKEGTGWLLPMRMNHIPNVDHALTKRFIKLFSLKRNVCQQSRAEMRSVIGQWPTEWPELLNITDDIAVVCYLKDPNESKDFDQNKPARRGAPMPQGFGLGPMALKYLKMESPDLTKFFKDNNRFADLDPTIAVPYACSDADLTLRIFNKQADPALLDSFVYKIDMGIIPALLEMEEAGVILDPAELSKVEKQVGAYLQETRAAAYEAIRLDSSANIDSPTQLARHITNVLNWPKVGKPRKDKLHSTDKNSMARWAESSDPEVAEGAQAIRRYKQWYTLHNNFLTKLHEYVNPHTSAVHCSFKNTVVPTGRLACGSPNMQQIPRNKNAPARRAFIPRPGRLFGEVDYSQIELRVYGGESGESYLLDAFETGEDLHLKTASVIFREQITDKEDGRRQMGKTMNFGPIYGMKAEGLAMRTDYDLAEAQRILDDFFSAMPDATRWTEQTIQKAKSRRGVHTHFGRWRPLPWLSSRIPHEVEFGERSAINTIVQGTAADIMKIGLIRLWKALKKHPVYSKSVQLVLTIHDSVLFEFDQGLDLPELCTFFEKQMCFPIEGYPPIEVDFKIGPNWNDMVPSEKWLSQQDPSYKPPEVQPTSKTAPIPANLSEESQKELLRMVQEFRDDSAELAVTFFSKKLNEEVGTFRMSPASYQKILHHLVTSSSTNGGGEQSAEHESAVSVSFN